MFIYLFYFFLYIINFKLLFLFGSFILSLLFLCECEGNVNCELRNKKKI